MPSDLFTRTLGYIRAFPATFTETPEKSVAAELVASLFTWPTHNAPQGNIMGRPRKQVKLVASFIIRLFPSSNTSVIRQFTPSCMTLSEIPVQFKGFGYKTLLFKMSLVKMQVPVNVSTFFIYHLKRPWNIPDAI